MPRVVQSSFAKGEIAPGLYGRVDTNIYGIALKTARNLVIQTTGGAANRAGTVYRAPVKDHTYSPRLIPFQFNTTDQYMLEFGNQYMRVMRNEAHVTEVPLAITGATKANPIVITCVSHGFAAGQEVFITGVVGMTRLNGNRYKVGTTTTNTFQLKNQADNTNIDGTNASYAAYVSGGTAARIYEIVTPYVTADLDTLKYEQNANVMTLTHPSYNPRELSRSGHAAWTLTIPTFQPTIPSPNSLAVAIHGGSGTGSAVLRYQATAVLVDTGEESLPAISGNTKAITGATQANPCVVTAVSHGFKIGDEIAIDAITGMTQLNGRRFIVSATTTNTLTLQNEDSTLFSAYVSGGGANATFFEITNSVAPANGQDNDVTCSTVGNAVSYNFYRNQNGLYGFIGSSPTPSFEDKITNPTLSVTPPRSRNPFLVAGTFPAAVSYFEQRRVMGGANNTPDQSNYSRTGAQENYSISIPGQDDDAITASLTSRQVNAIRHYVAARDLVIFTSGSEWRVNSGGQSFFGATTIDQKPQSTWGCSHLRPQIVGREVLYLTDTASSVRSLGYSWQIDGYEGSEVSLTARHLFKNRTIVDWTYAQNPEPVAYLVRNDGQLLVLTYHLEQQVVAWTHWDTLGSFARAAVLRKGLSATEDEVYFVVVRNVNGNQVRYIETNASRIFGDVTGCFFVDCGLAYSGAPVTTIHGFDYIEGQAVSVLADGNVIDGLSVLNGAVTLPSPASKVAIGLPYLADFETLDITDRSTLDGYWKKLSNVAFRLEDTRGIFIGPNSDKLDEWKLREDEDFNSPTALFTGQTEIPITPEWNMNGRVFVRQSFPLPMTILSIAPDVSVGG